MVLERMLQKAGHHVVTVDNGEDALSALAAVDFDGNRRPAHTPGVNGLDLLRELRVMEAGGGKRTPVLVLSADVTPESIQRCQQAGRARVPPSRWSPRACWTRLPKSPTAWAVVMTAPAPLRFDLPPLQDNRTCSMPPCSTSPAGSAWARSSKVIHRAVPARCGGLPGALAQAGERNSGTRCATTRTR